MHYVLYASTAAIPFSDNDLADLLRVSRRNNASTNVSGMLHYHDSSFLQYIEGEIEDVTPCLIASRLIQSVSVCLCSTGRILTFGSCQTGRWVTRFCRKQRRQSLVVST